MGAQLLALITVNFLVVLVVVFFFGQTQREACAFGN